MTPLKLNLSSLAVVAILSGCSHGPEVIGDNSPTPTKTGLAAFAANWDGYIEAYKFMDGSDRVRITVKEDGTGTIRSGNEDLWPAPTDPDTKYPPNYPSPSPSNTFRPLNIPAVWDGFLFTLHDIRVETERLRASAQSLEIFGGWCHLQDPHQQLNGSYSCSSCNVFNIPDPSSDNCYTYNPCPQLDAVPAADATEGLVPILCEKLDLCLMSALCTCDAAGCSIGTAPQDIVVDSALLDAQLTLTGTLVLAGTNYTIRLKRQ